MKKDKVVRALIPYSITDYYLDKGEEKGLAAEYLREFEKHINKGIRKEGDKIRVVLLPTQRDALLSGLVEGYGDIAVADLTITPDRLKIVDFSDPVRTNVRELVVTGPIEKELKGLDDLSNMEIHVRKSSSYFQSLLQINAELEKNSKQPVKIVAVDEALEDEDLLEMVDAGILPAIVVDDHRAELWEPLYENIWIHKEFAIREEGDIAWAFRKDSPELKKVVNSFISKTHIGTELGNIFARRYSSNIENIINPKTEKYLKELDNLVEIFEATGKKYNIDPMLLAAQAFQESRFRNSAKSRTGAVGIMQVLPSTAKDPNVAIKEFRQLAGNIEAGAKYNRFLADKYFSDPEISELDKILFVLASYNAGPNRVAKVRMKAKNPNVWFDNVEWEVARAAGVEPIKYVKNIYIYFVVFSRIDDYDRRREKAAE
ncbi:transglycosylase SLT domain-containing protein [Stappia sediminis]|nr:lytic transglycosylase F [Stappia sediminis]